MNYLTSYVGRIFRGFTAPFRWILNAPTIFVSAPKRLMGLTLPARVAIITAICLVVVLLVYLLCALALVEETIEPGVWFREYGLIAVLLIIAIPLVTYFMLKLWLQGDTSRFPDIDAAWKVGLSALEQRGLDLKAIPIYLVLGSARQQQVKALFDASGLDFDVGNTPHGHAPLEWFANDQGVFLVLNDASVLSKTNSVALNSQGEGGQPRSAPSAGQEIRGTLAAGDVTGQSQDSGAGDSGAWDDGGAGDDGDQLRGTMVPQINQTLAPGAGRADAQRGSRRPASMGHTNLARQEAEEQTERLRYVCQLLSRARQPLCPINGILTLISVQVVQNIMDAKEVQDAIAVDLTTLHNTLELCSPVVALVVGMEQKSGFFELVRRVGAKSRFRRFGKGFQVWSRSGEEQLSALSLHACGAFEDWVYHLFQEPGGLNKPNNRKLYNLLCEIRLHLQTRIQNILVNAFTCDSAAEAGGEPPWLFGGCYFAATGETEDRQAFVRDVFRRMFDLQEDVEWSRRALSANERYQRFAQIGILVDGLLALALIGLLAVHFFGS